jgi:hypothetical protein
MINRRSLIKTASAALAAVVMATSAPAFADVGKVRLKFGGGGFIVGLNAGAGTLSFHGQTFPLKIGGLSVGTIGASGGTLVGTASNLHAPTDIIGTYTAIGAGIAIAGGVRVYRMQNQNGVVLELRGRQIGFEANAGLGGFSLSM